MALTAKTQKRQAAGSKDGGQFAPDPRADMPEVASDRFNLGGGGAASETIGAVRRRLGAIRETLARDDLTTPEVASAWADSNSLASVLLRQRDAAAGAVMRECIGEPGDQSGGFVELGAAAGEPGWKLKWGNGVSEQTSIDLRNSFYDAARLPGAELRMLLELERDMWTDSAYSPSGLRALGIDPSECAEYVPSGRAAIVPDDDNMGARCEVHAQEAQIVCDDEMAADNFIAAAVMYDEAAAVRNAAVARTAEVSGWQPGDKAELRGEDGQTVGTIREQGHWKNWDSDAANYAITLVATERHDQERAGKGQTSADSDLEDDFGEDYDYNEMRPELLADVILTARSNRWRSSYAKPEPQAKPYVKRMPPPTNGSQP